MDSAYPIFSVRFLLLFLFCNESHAKAVVSVAVDVTRVELFVKESHAVCVSHRAGRRCPIETATINMAAIGTIAFARSGKEDNACSIDIIPSH